MDLIAVMAYISILEVVDEFTTFVSNDRTIAGMALIPLMAVMAAMTTLTVIVLRLSLTIPNLVWLLQSFLRPLQPASNSHR